MRGRAALESMRRDGYAPSLVIIDLDDHKLRMAKDWEHHNPTTARLAPAGEPPHRADLRCVVGLTVFVHGDEPEAVHAWRDACIEAKARRVVAAVTVLDTYHEAFQTTEIHDTAGVLRG